MVLAGAALDGLIVDVAGEVDDDKVTLGGRPALDRLQAGHALAQALDRFLDLIIGDLDDLLLHFDARVPREAGPWPHGDGRLEAERGVVVFEALEIELGVVDGLDAGIGHGGLIPHWQGVIERLREDGLLAEARDEHRPGNLPLAEAGDVDVAGQVADGVVDPGRHLILGHLDVQLDLVVLECRDAGFYFRHKGRYLMLDIRFWIKTKFSPFGTIRC